jgi:hypothetical protein
VNVSVYRGGKKMDIPVKLGERTGTEAIILGHAARAAVDYRHYELNSARSFSRSSSMSQTTLRRYRERSTRCISACLAAITSAFASVGTYIGDANRITVREKGLGIKKWSHVFSNVLPLHAM